MHLSPGEIVGILGANGAGKTTLMSIISGLLKGYEGEFDILGACMNQQCLRAIRSRIGFVPQDIALYAQLTVYENLRFFYHIHGLPAQELEQSISYWLDRFDLSSKKDALVSQLSGGMQRKVNIIAALLHKPEILIMDEPAAGVDIHSRHSIYEILEEFRDQKGSLLYTSHYLQEAERLCDRVYILEKGSLIAQGAPATLLEGHGVQNLDELFISITGYRIWEETI